MPYTIWTRYNITAFDSSYGAVITRSSIFWSGFYTLLVNHIIVSCNFPRNFVNAPQICPMQDKVKFGAGAMIAKGLSGYFV